MLPGLMKAAKGGAQAGKFGGEGVGDRFQHCRRRRHMLQHAEGSSYLCSSWDWRRGGGFWVLAGTSTIGARVRQGWCRPYLSTPAVACSYVAAWQMQGAVSAPAVGKAAEHSWQRQLSMRQLQGLE
jgi:hypothetical protein